jgi:hypothetical protein
MSHRLYRIAGLLLLNALVLVDPALAQGKRVALVIGNSEYKHTLRLENPKNDAADVGAALKQLGFAAWKGSTSTRRRWIARSETSLPRSTVPWFLQSSLDARYGRTRRGEAVRGNRPRQSRSRRGRRESDRCRRQ